VPAAVLLPLYLKDGECHLLFNKRTQSVEHHKGEISFPGGAKDPEDSDLMDTALRETWEEMGIRREDLRILGRLDDTLTHTGFAVSSFVGAIPYPYPFRPSPLEIAEVLEVPVVHLMTPVNQREEVAWLDGTPVKMYSYTYGRHLIYGATARILDQFLGLVRETLAEEGQP
jgi:8-oxo-dGTP pyrophosphatase MutT (NUDIX family)